MNPNQPNHRMKTPSVVYAMLCERIEAGSAGEQVVLPCEPVEGDTLGVIHPSDKATS